jgi:hypothetical protein
MKPNKTLAAVVIVGGLGFGAFGAGAGVASATPAAPIPLRPPGHGDDCGPLCGDNRGPGRHGGPNFDGNWDGRWNQNQRHDVNQRWDDRWGAPPWGWGPPPPLRWNGGFRPQQVDYWGYQASPVWDDGFHQWGIWLFGIWIPIFGAGFN